MLDAPYHALALWHIVQQSCSLWTKLIKQFGSPEHALRAGTAEWQPLGCSDKILALLSAWQRQTGDVYLDICRSADYCQQQHISLLLTDDALYPPLLKEIANAPPLLFCQGNLSALSWPQIAMVGTRRPTQAGQQLAAQFAQVLASQGLAITSGLALGIDGIAHQAALEAQGMTVAVLGTGLAHIYPRQHKRLAANIVAQEGVLISEFLPFTAPLNYHFPRRNRIISGLSMGVLVVEAALESGSLITAQLAAEQNREVWAIPSSVFNVQARGCHALIRQGATLVEEPIHILEEIGGCLAQFHPTSASQEPQLSEDVISTEAQQVLATLGWQVQSFDALMEQGNWHAATLANLLMELELAGRIATVAGGYEQLK
ncbi:DNA-processing protein DprA [Agitococcus lubricus]|uniref:DNA protecting protein DprA n=1 Tax=Agitococcus lubricus TaxID=1077255 RepID=A0A2T5IY48_9GAMM|nr:DNA-processing protein DprA [Agitococcus lubricus]PTQ88906.1 DNA protecting protein DprA [Agitococcus lubricus]